MSEIELRWTEENEELIDRQLKLATLRRGKHARFGDTFTVRGKRYVFIRDPRPMTLREAADYYYPLFGQSTPAAVIAALERAYASVHPFDQTQVWYLHEFRRDVTQP